MTIVARSSRREDLLASALELFVERGYDGTSVSELVERVDLSKAAFVYHFDSKEDVLIELAEPLIDDLDAVLSRHSSAPGTHGDLSVLLHEYLGVLSRHHVVARWVDADKSVLNHRLLGPRLAANNDRLHRILCGPRADRTARAMASAVLGMLWRPVRNGYLSDDPRSQKAVLELATKAAQSL